MSKTHRYFQKKFMSRNLVTPQPKAQKQILEKLTPVLESMVGKRRIDITNIKINKGIPAEKFTIELLDGYTVYDEFLDKYYIVGEPLEAL